MTICEHNHIKEVCGFCKRLKEALKAQRKEALQLEKLLR